MLSYDDYYHELIGRAGFSEDQAEDALVDYSEEFEKGIECVECGSKNVTASFMHYPTPCAITRTHTETLLIFTPFRECQDCKFSWRDYMSERIIDIGVKNATKLFMIGRHEV